MYILQSNAGSLVLLRITARLRESCKNSHTLVVQHDNYYNSKKSQEQIVYLHRAEKVL